MDDPFHEQFLYATLVFLTRQMLYHKFHIYDFFVHYALFLCDTEVFA